jgi:ElaB/YqjD/DUF883 family membrane-anchored ribosome-binding protein
VITITRTGDHDRVESPITIPGMRSQGQHYVRQARERYPEAERHYQDGSRAISQRITETPWLSLVVAGAAGYGLGWMIHGRWSNHGQ